MVVATTLSPGAGRRIGPGISVKVDVGQSPDFVVLESRLPPGWAGPPAHVHGGYDESFYVVAGRVRFTVDGRARDEAPGGFVHVPRGAAHAFANPGKEPAVVLLTATPGALTLIEEIYELIGEDGSFDVAEMAALYARHQSEIL